jgi:ATP-dependent helicase/DNAse subunit B
LSVVAQVRAVPGELERRDIAALQALKDLLRGLVWAEEALSSAQVPFAHFFEELAGAVESAQYHVPTDPSGDEVLVADVVQARGLSHRAVAILGMAEGEFPATISEDPFLRDADRRRLREEFGLPLEPSTESDEAGYFYEAVSRPTDQLLLTRPRIADDSAEWQPSPFWEEVRRLVDTEPSLLTSDAVAPPDQAASWPELLESLPGTRAADELREWIAGQEPDRLMALSVATEVLGARLSGRTGSPYDGSLELLHRELGRRFGPGKTWSASRLEAYRACPFLFYVTNVLGLEPRQDPSEGLEPWQSGNIYHAIFEAVYGCVADPTDIGELQAALPGVAEKVLADAPQREGFRESAWWEHLKSEIAATAATSLEALWDEQGPYTPAYFEARFGLSGKPPLIVRDGRDSFALRGLIDRVDIAPDGRLRVIDYKSAGKSAFTAVAVERGKKLQLPLYGLAARDALGLGEVADGFYWHLHAAERSSFTMARFRGGPERAIGVAVEHAWTAIRSAREGHFEPLPPDDGCPSWCPAGAFCWHRRMRYRG